MATSYLEPDAFIKEIKNWDKLTWRNVNTLIKQISYDVFSEVIANTPVDTGLARNQWVFSYGSAPEGKIVKASGSGTGFDKSGQRAIKKVFNGLKRSLVVTKYKVGKEQYFLTNSATYINRLEFDGHSKQAPNGMARLAVQKAAKQGVNKYASAMKEAMRNKRSLELGTTKYYS